MWRQYYHAMYHAARVAEIHRQQAAMQPAGDAHQAIHHMWRWGLVVATILAVLLLFGVRFAH